jgi:type III restriction enzyme
VDYLKPSGRIGFYYPDWVVIQNTRGKEINWIIETKGRVWEGTAEKDRAMEAWCEQVSAATGGNWKYMRVNQTDFDRLKPKSLNDLVDHTSAAGQNHLL